MRSKILLFCVIGLWHIFGSHSKFLSNEDNIMKILKNKKNSFSESKSSCPIGYKLKVNSCVPVCDKCENSICIAPDICKCLTGYVNTTIKNKCKPLCMEKCLNAICVAKNTCNCIQGYTFKNQSRHECEPICSNPCIEGECYSLEECRNIKKPIKIVARHGIFSNPLGVTCSTILLGVVGGLVFVTSLVVFYYRRTTSGNTYSSNLS